MRVKTLGVRGTEDKSAITIVRPGYCTTYDNGPEEADVRSSAGFRPTYGKDSYTKENISSVIDAMHRLQVHYDPQKLLAIGYSGGAVIIVAGLCLLPQYAPEGNILAAYLCKRTDWANSNNFPSLSGSVSPHSVLVQITRNIEIIEVAGINDSNTTSRLMKKCFISAQEAGLNVSCLEVEATHDTIMRTRELIDVVRKLIGTGSN